ncbi:transglutaminase family protein [Blastochloris tepida]|uniref:Transglutaminase n=1 Tax=Blastochloris tepida TaxID=2233851 RepID=A0A348FX84_9HYPH|nr:transglutaminase family protein [Blastochloris tepida]BBF91917.1 transglutaminase [Blastochloris tepida]
MRICISHETRYRYEQPVNGLIQILRLAPRNHNGQYVVDWRVEVSADCRLERHEDAFGNLTDTFSVHGHIDQLNVLVAGEVETEDTNGVVRGTVERLPVSLFLRETDLTRADPAIEAFALDIAGSSEPAPLSRLHALLTRLNDDMVYDRDPTHAATTAAEAFALKRGVCQDITHIFIATARRLGIPTRYIGGYYFSGSDGDEAEASHAWAEAFVPDLGWIGFDATNGICITDAHVRVAMGLDYLGAAPVRGSRRGGAGESLTVEVHVGQSPMSAQSQMQRQSQS